MPNWQEWLGYIASLIVLVSLLMSSVKKLRWINMIGSLVFAVYGFIISAYPVAVMNLGIVIINSYYLYQMYTKKDYFTLLQVHDDSYFKAFAQAYEKDMKQFMSVDGVLDNRFYKRYFVLRNTNPAGIIVGSRIDDTFEIMIDYVTPTYRDFKIGVFLFRDQKHYFQEQGINVMISNPGSELHQRYLKRMGFVQQSDGKFYLKFKEIKK